MSIEALAQTLSTMEPKDVNRLLEIEPPIIEILGDPSGQEEEELQLDKQAVFVKKFQIAGNTHIPTAKLEQLVHSEQGRMLTLENMRGAASRITEYYRGYGYLLAYAYLPPQDISDGIIRIDIHEGQIIGRIEVSGAESLADTMIIQAALAPLIGGMLKERPVETVISWLNERYDFRFKGVALKPGESPGTTDLVVTLVQDVVQPPLPDAATSLDELALAHHAKGDYAMVEALLRQAFAIRESSFASDHINVATALNNLAGFFCAHGDYGQAEPFLRRVIAIREEILGPEHPEVVRSLKRLAVTYDALGLYVQAEPVRLRLLALTEKVAAGEELISRLEETARFYVAHRQYAKAEPLWRRALGLVEKRGGAKGFELVIYLDILAALQHALGEYTQAATSLHRALRILEDTDSYPYLFIYRSGPWIRRIYSDMGRSARLEHLYRRALTLDEMFTGPSSMDPAILAYVAEYYLDQGQYTQAEALLQRALTLREKRTAFASSGLLTDLDRLSVAYRGQMQFGPMELILRRALAIREETVGPEHPDVARNLANLAYSLAAQRKTTEACQLYARAQQVLLAVSRANIEAGQEMDGGGARGLEEPLRDYLALLAQVAREATLETDAPPAALEAFKVAEQARGGATQGALARAGARAATGDPATAQLARKVQELQARWQALQGKLAEHYRKPSHQRDGILLSALHGDEGPLARELTEATDRLFNAFPRYAELVAPDPIDTSGVQSLLRPDEALVSILALSDRLLVWLVRPGQAPVYRDIPINHADVAKMVERVRKSLDQSLNPDLATGRLLPFDVEGSHELYTLLLAPLRPYLSGLKHLLVVPDEVLLPLPFGILVTQAEGEVYQVLAELYAKQLSPAPAELAAYATLSWLAKEYAITVLPSATSLRALRQIAQARGTAVEPFIGIGDPVLQGGGRRRGGVMLAARGARVPVEVLRRLDRLPGTRDELKAVATALGADSTKALYLDTEATKPTVMTLNASGRLGQVQVLGFATHGLLAGELKGLTQPALVLTPPEKPSEEDDGLLALEDVLELKLPSADWVVLSACNTAAGDGSGEGLAGLARAFFFAGARSLLVSYWSVEDRATQTLMTEVFQRYAADKTMPRAEALRQGMLALLGQAQGPTAYFAHPFAWAPFFLVGDGGTN